MRKLSIALLGVVLTGFSTYLWHEAHLWPFYTRTNGEAFLGATFGMTPTEVRRALQKHGGVLLTYEDYRRVETDPLIPDIQFTPLFSEDRRRDSSLYMPSVEIYDSKVEAEFGFVDVRLAYVAVHFDPISPSKAQSVVASVESKLRSAYEFSSREESKEVPGAYSLNFRATSVAPSLWVNLTEPEKPIIILNLVSETAQSQRKQEMEQRERSAFGTKR